MMFDGLWPLIWHYSAAVLIVAACLAVVIFSAALTAEIPLLKPFIDTIRRWALMAAIITASATFFYAIGVSNGENHINAKWQAAENAAVSKGKKARAAAVHDVRKLPAGRVRGDTNDRDNR